MSFIIQICYRCAYPFWSEYAGFHKKGSRKGIVKHVYFQLIKTFFILVKYKVYLASTQYRQLTFYWILQIASVFQSAGVSSNEYRLVVFFISLKYIYTAVWDTPNSKKWTKRSFIVNKKGIPVVKCSLRTEKYS